MSAIERGLGPDSTTREEEDEARGNTMKHQMNWYNHRTKQWEDGPMPYNKDAIPQDPASQGLFSIYIEHKEWPPERAVLDVLSRNCGVEPPTDERWAEIEAGMDDH